MTAQAISDWLAGYLARCLAVSLDDIDVQLPFDCYGLDSRKAAILVSDLADWLGRDLDLNVIYDYGTIAELSVYLASPTDPGQSQINT
jgi:acyl carrier protein